MIGIVVVSHSRALAEAALGLAREMVPGDEPKVRVAAGTSDGGIGTDATAVADAITEVASPDGVLVLMDLGSAVLSAELALEFIDASALGAGGVRLTPAPIVEGLVAALVVAAGGATLDEVDREARNALAAKESQLGPASALTPPVEPLEPVEPVGVTRTFTLTNPDGLHTRPASQIVAAVSKFDATITIATEGKAPANARSPIGLMALGVLPGHDITVAASGPQASEAMDAIAALIADRFGEDPPA